MTQDQYGQARGTGEVDRGDVVPDNETEEARSDESRPATRFQRVASALLGSGSERDKEDRAAGDPAAEERVPADTQAAATEAGGLPWVTPEDEAAMAGSPISRETAQKHDYWDDADAAAGHEDDAVAVTSPDTAGDHQATEPDMFGTTRTGEVPAAAPAAEGQPGAATIADVPAARTPMGAAPAGAAPAGASPAGDVPAPAGDVPGAAAEAAGSTGRHAAAAQTPSANGELRPGEATGKLGDFSDLTYGNLIPDAAHYTDQWQQIQFKFVDDPHASVTEAADIIGQVTATASSSCPAAASGSSQ